MIHQYLDHKWHHVCAFWYYWGVGTTNKSYHIRPQFRNSDSLNLDDDQNPVIHFDALDRAKMHMCQRFLGCEWEIKFVV